MFLSPSPTSLHPRTLTLSHSHSLPPALQPSTSTLVLSRSSPFFLPLLLFPALPHSPPTFPFPLPLLHSPLHSALSLFNSLAFPYSFFPLYFWFPCCSFLSPAALHVSSFFIPPPCTSALPPLPPLSLSPLPLPPCASLFRFLLPLFPSASCFHFPLPPLLPIPFCPSAPHFLTFCTSALILSLTHHLFCSFFLARSTTLLLPFLHSRSFFHIFPLSLSLFLFLSFFLSCLLALSLSLSLSCFSCFPLSHTLSFSLFLFPLSLTLSLLVFLFLALPVSRLLHSLLLSPFLSPFCLLLIHSLFLFVSLSLTLPVFTLAFSSPLPCSLSFSLSYIHTPLLFLFFFSCNETQWLFYLFFSSANDLLADFLYFWSFSHYSI